MKKLFILFVLVLYAGMSFSQDLQSDLFSLTKIKEGLKSKRAGSWDKTGGNTDCMKDIKDGEKATIMDVKGAGVISHIWITIAPGADQLNRNDIIIRMFWDGNYHLPFRQAGENRMSAIFLCLSVTEPGLK